MNDYELIDVFQSQQTLVDVERVYASELLLFVMIETHTHIYTEKMDSFEGMIKNDVLKTQWGVLEKRGLIVLECGW